MMTSIFIEFGLNIVGQRIFNKNWSETDAIKISKTHPQANSIDTVNVSIIFGKNILESNETSTSLLGYWCFNFLFCVFFDFNLSIYVGN